jgi:transposase InsO family protein
MAELGARHLTTRPFGPRTNGKAERFIQTALREWREPSALKAWAAAIAARCGRKKAKIALAR